MTSPQPAFASPSQMGPALTETRTALVTGSNGGVGLALAERLAGDGWRVLLHGRDPDKLARARARLGVGGPHAAFRADLAHPDGPRQLAAAVAEATRRLDVLVHNAGLLRPSRERTEDGVEVTLAVNALAPFRLTQALRPLLASTADAQGGARVVTVSSEAHAAGRLPGPDVDALVRTFRGPDDPARYSSVMAYATAKLTATCWTLELARRLADDGVTAHACHPGVVRTGVFGGMGGVLGAAARLASFLYLSPAAGAASPHLLATAPPYGERTGRWVTRGHFREPHEADPPPVAARPDMGAAVWEALATLA